MQNQIDRYEVVKKIGKELFGQSDVVKSGKVNPKDIELAKEFLAKAVTSTNPDVLSLYFEHVMIAPELGKRIVERLIVNRYLSGVSWEGVEFLLWFHDLGRIIDPGGYLRNDIIDDNLLLEFGFSKNLLQNLPPVRTFLQVGAMLDLNQKQIQGEENLNLEQEKIALDYFNLLTPTQKIILLADNFGKRDEKGLLFSLETFLRYLRTEKRRYQGDKNWAIDRMPGGEILNIYIVEKTINWLETLGVDFEAIIKGLIDYGPKFVILARHGDFLNPSGLVYNTDFVMRKYNKEIIHLSPKGKEQMRRLGQLIKKRKFRVKRIISSPSARAAESRDNLNQTFALSNIQTVEELDDVYLPGPIAEGMTMRQFQELGGGSSYDDSRWKIYRHEKPESVIKRLDDSFWKMAASLKVGETGVMVSHGDPIAWWINHQVTGAIPNPRDLRNLIYPNKGDAIVAIIGPDGKWISHYILKDPSLIEGESF